MNDSILVQLPLLSELLLPSPELGKTSSASTLHDHWLHQDALPAEITQSPTVMRVLDLIGPLDWSHFPERDLKPRFGQTTYPYAAYVAAELIKLNEGLGSLNRLHRFLEEHSGFKSLLGFLPPYPLNWGCSFNTRLKLPTQRHFTRVLREMPNAALQFLLADSVKLIRAELHARGITSGDVISLDTKHILAFVKENNPKAYVARRFDKTQQPTGDPDCRRP